MLSAFGNSESRQRHEGKGLVSNRVHWEPKAGGRHQGNPFAMQQHEHKADVLDKGRLTHPVDIDTAAIYPTSSSGDALQERCDAAAKSFEQGKLMVVPNRELKRVSSIRTHIYQPHHSIEDANILTAPRQRLRRGINEEALKALLPPPDDRKSRLVEQNSNGPHLVDVLLRQQFPVPHYGPPPSDFPMMHVKPSPRGHISQLPFGPQATHSEPSPPTLHGRRAFRPLEPTAEASLAEGRRIQPNGVPPPQTGRNPITGDVLLRPQGHHQGHAANGLPRML